MNSKNTITTILASGALALAVISAQAQTARAPYSQVSVSANTNPYGVLGFNNIYGLGVAAGLGSAGGFAGLGGVNPFNSYFGLPLGGFSGSLAGNNISLVGGGGFGFSTIGPNGTYFTGPNGPYNPYLNPHGGDYLPVLPQNGQAKTGQAAPSAAAAAPDRTSPEALARSIVIRRGRDYSISVAWRGDPKLLSSMKVTLLNQYHLPLAQQDAVADAPANFAAGQNAYTARYYRVNVQYVDGAVATMTGRLTR